MCQSLNEAIRKVVQNTIDGAVGWLQQDEDSNCTSSSSSVPGKQKSDVRPGGEGWNTINKGKPSKWTKTTRRLQEAGFVHFGIAEVTLIVRDGNDLTTKREGGKRKKERK